MILEKLLKIKSYISIFEDFGPKWTKFRQEYRESVNEKDKLLTILNFYQSIYPELAFNSYDLSKFLKMKVEIVWELLNNSGLVVHIADGWYKFKR